MWMLLMLLVLNFQYLGISSVRERPQLLLGIGPPSPAQGLALGLLGQSADVLLERGERHPVFKDWEEELRSRRIGYTGEECSQPEMLTLPRVLPGLPSEGIATSVNPLPWCSEVVRGFFVDPESLLIEPSLFRP